MLKKLIIASASATLLGAGIANAGTMGVVCPEYEYLFGPYIGASVGTQTNTMGAPAYYRGIAGTLSGGWGMRFGRRFYLAGEVFGGSNLETLNRPGALPFSAKSSWFYGVSAIPGFLINERALAYVRAGGTRTDFNQAGRELTAWHVGVGGQTNLFANVDLRGEYVYSQYDRLFGGPRPLQDLFNVGLVYKFV